VSGSIHDFTDCIHARWATAAAGIRVAMNFRWLIIAGSRVCLDFVDTTVYWIAWTGFVWADDGPARI